MSRICFKCKVEKSLESFNKDSSRKDGVSYRCRECSKIKDRNIDYKKKYAKHRIENLQRQKKYRIIPEIRLAGLLSQAKRRPKSKKLGFDLDLEWILNEYNKRNGCCSLTGIRFTLLNNDPGKRYQFPYSPSIDRIDSNKGYTKDNCRLVCAIVNFGLHRFGEDVYEYVCKAYLVARGFTVEKALAKPSLA